jgi:hypothetical protein
MPKTILLVSRDENLQNSRALVLAGAGYRTIRTDGLISAVQRSFYCEMAIIGHTFSPNEQEDFIERVHEGYPSVFVLCLRFGLTQPRALLTAVANCFDSQPGGSEFAERLAWRPQLQPGTPVAPDSIGGVLGEVESYSGSVVGAS